MNANNFLNVLIIICLMLVLLILNGIIIEIIIKKIRMKKFKNLNIHRGTNVVIKDSLWSYSNKKEIYLIDKIIFEWGEFYSYKVLFHSIKDNENCNRTFLDIEEINNFFKPVSDLEIFLMDNEKIIKERKEQQYENNRKDKNRFK